MKNRKYELCDLLNLAVFVILAISGIWMITRYLVLAALEPVVLIILIEVLYILAALAAWKGRMPWLLLPVAVTGFVLAYTTNYAETTAYNWAFWLQAGAAAACVLLGTILMLVQKKRHRMIPVTELAALILLLAGSLIVWGGFHTKDRNLQGRARHTMWAVPSQFDRAECAQPGTVEELLYQTKAYGTDERELTKRALVYLPYGYDEDGQYNILYLMHGTGDDENYWLSTYSYNKTMLDNLIASGNIDPLIVVTPTFYVEDDFKDTGLDPLTYSFKDELRNDLMPAAEGKYATYAKSCDEEGFRDSRDHRAFAGLSRGAVTTYHSALCGSLDYISWFGTFSGSRTDAGYFKETLQSDELKEYPIHYLYVTSGTFDFALPRQCQDNDGLLVVEPRLTEGLNTDMDIFPMRYHSMGNWHLALYNLLQRVFVFDQMQ